MAGSAQRILYVISAYSGSTTASGGHYYSVRDVGSVLQAEWPGTEFRILVLGDLLPKPVIGGGVSYVHVSPAGKSFPRYCREVVASADDFSPTIVHAYDNKSYFFARLIARRHRAKRFLTKPGGPNPGITFPYCPDVVCFSEENASALRSRRRLRSTRVHLIPNRIVFPTPDAARIAALRAAVGPGDLLLRISRIGHYHRRTIEQTFALAALMRREAIQVRAVIIGAVESEEVVASLRAMAGPGDLIVTDPAFTVDSSALLDAATYVVGTGRGVIEAVMRNKYVFVPLAGEEIPALVTPANWQALSAANFSERTPALAGSDPADLSLLQRLLGDPAGAEDFRGRLFAAITGEYGPERLPARYEALYSADQSTRAIEPLDRLVNAGAFLVPYLRWRRNSRRT